MFFKMIFKIKLVTTSTTLFRLYFQYAAYSVYQGTWFSGLLEQFGETSNQRDNF